MMLMQTEIRAEGLRRNGTPIGRRPSVGTIELMGFTVSYPPNKEIYGEEEEATHLYKVLRGAVRTTKILEDGRRQIAAFYVPGDVFGLESRDYHTFSAEAVGQCKLLLIQRSTLVALAERNNDVARQLWTLTTAELQRVQDHSLLVTKSALARVAGFLVEMAERFSARDELELPMGRQDIADYLALTIETVSRSLTHLENVAAIEIPTPRRILLRNHSTLMRLSHS